MVAPSPGESKPIADNRTSDGQARNRRVEVFDHNRRYPAAVAAATTTVTAANRCEEGGRGGRKANRRRGGAATTTATLQSAYPSGALVVESTSQWLDETLSPLPGKWLARKIRDALIKGSCYGLEALLTQAGGRLGDQQKEELRKQCRGGREKADQMR